MPLSLALGVGLLGAAHLVVYYRGDRAVAGVLKPLPVLLLAASVWLRGGHPYAGLVAAGLVMSAVGDVSLVFPSGFVAGLSAFLVAHVLYIVALQAGGLSLDAAAMGIGLVLAGIAAIMLCLLWPRVGRMRPAVVVYVTALAAMVWCAVTRAMGADAPPGAPCAAVGAASFMLSDGLLSVNRFVRPVPGAHAGVMVTYYLAQALIAASALAG
jgi:uncharacterized membrane protein YhhN